MKEFQICPKCEKEGPPHEVGEEKFKFCPYCGAPYYEEYERKAGSVRGTRSRVEMSASELRKGIDKAHQAIHEYIEHIG